MSNNEYDEFEEVVEVCCYPKLGEAAPDFDAVTTHGKIKLSEYNKGSWVILFSHPADFTPVCTTEFAAFAEKQDEFSKRNVKLLGLSVDSVYSHIAWVKDIEKSFDVKINFPIIADLPMDVSHLYGMIHPAVSETYPVRSIFIIDQKGILRTMIYYPSSVGRNINEIIRLVDSLQVVDKEQVATPVNWKPGDSVIIPPPHTTEEAAKSEHGSHEECKTWYLCKKKV